MSKAEIAGPKDPVWAAAYGAAIATTTLKRIPPGQSAANWTSQLSRVSLEGLDRDARAIADTAVAALATHV